MDNFIVKCDHCGQIYKARREGNRLLTDFNDDITECCLKCRGTLGKMIRTDDWVADLFFKIKGK